MKKRQTLNLSKKRILSRNILLSRSSLIGGKSSARLKRRERRISKPSLPPKPKEDPKVEQMRLERMRELEERKLLIDRHQKIIKDRISKRKSEEAAASAQAAKRQRTEEEQENGQERELDVHDVPPITHIQQAKVVPEVPPITPAVSETVLHEVPPTTELQHATPEVAPSDFPILDVTPTHATTSELEKVEVQKEPKAVIVPTPTVEVAESATTQVPKVPIALETPQSSKKPITALVSYQYEETDTESSQSLVVLDSTKVDTQMLEVSKVLDAKKQEVQQSRVEEQARMGEVGSSRGKEAAIPILSTAKRMQKELENLIAEAVVQSTMLKESHCSAKDCTCGMGTFLEDVAVYEKCPGTNL